jgi:hypothetical protein
MEGHFCGGSAAGDLFVGSDEVPISLGATRLAIKSLIHSATACRSFSADSSTAILGGGPLKTETVPFRSSTLPSTSVTSGIQAKIRFVQYDPGMGW